MTARTQGERIVALEAANKALAIEIRDLKAEQHQLSQAVNALSQALNEHRLALAPLLAANVRLAQLIEEADKAKGAGALAKFLVGGGILGGITSAILGIFYFFSKG